MSNATRLFVAVLFTAGCLSAVAPGDGNNSDADHYEEADLGKKEPGDAAEASVNPPGTVISGDVTNAGGWPWAGGPKTFNAKVPADFSGNHSSQFNGTWTRGGGGGAGPATPLTWEMDAKASSCKIESMKITAGPSYALPEGTVISGESFEIEIGDSVTVTLEMTPSDCDGSCVEWSGDGVSGNGLSKTVSYSETGTKKITATCGDNSVSATIYVNNNEAEPARISPATPQRDKKWAHCGDETIKLTASANAWDYDWKNGRFDTENNNIDLEQTEWISSSFGTVSPAMGEITYWTPPDDNTGTGAVKVIYHDKTDEYTPRDDKQKVCEIEVGAFKVKVVLSMSVGSDDAQTAVVTEDDNKPVLLSSGLKSIEAVENRGWNTGGEGKDEDQLFVNYSWIYKTIPASAEFEGLIRARIATAGGAGLHSVVWDSDIIDDGDASAVLEIKPSIAGIGFDFTALVDFDGDEHEGSVLGAAGFDSDYFSNINPNNVKIEDTSSNYADLRAGPIGRRKHKPFTKKREVKSIDKGNSEEEVKARYDFYAYARCRSTKRMVDGAEMKINNISTWAQILDVEYVAENGN